MKLYPMGFLLSRLKRKIRWLSFRIVICIFAKYASQQANEFLTRLFEELANDCGLTSDDVKYAVGRSRVEGYGFYTKILPVLGKSLDVGLSDGQFHCPSHFRKCRGSEIPLFMSSLWLKVFTKSGALRSDADHSSVRFLRQICFYAYKADLPCTSKSIKDCLQRFVHNDLSVGSFEPSDLAISIIPAIRVFMQRYFSSCEDSGRARYSNGATSDGLEYSERFSSPIPPRSYPVHENSKFFMPGEAIALDRLDRYPVWNHFDYFRDGISARVLLVPKDSRGPRIISCENSHNMFLQLGLMDSLVNHIESHPLTRGRVNFSDQTINQELARSGSIDRSLCTMDLKDASDLNGHWLFKSIFRDTGWLFNSLEASRTTQTILPNGDTIKLNKFAPMGSAVCFPVMAITLFMIIHVGLLLVDETYSDDDRPYVYGDDIIIKSRHRQVVERLLTEFGFCVNTQKTFSESYFLESCGFDSFKGTNVTPVRVKRICQPIEGNIVSSVSLANNLMIRGYVRAAEYVHSCVERIIGKLPYGIPTSPYLHRVTTQDRVSICNYNWKQNCGSVKLWTVQSIKINRSEHPWDRMRRTFPSLGLDISLPKIGEFVSPRRLRLVKRRYSRTVLATGR